MFFADQVDSLSTTFRTEQINKSKETVYKDLVLSSCPESFRDGFSF